MKKPELLLTSFLIILSSCGKVQPEAVMTVSLDKKGAPVSPSMYGIFFEEINHAGDGGLYAELVQNRAFEDTDIPEGYTVKEDRIYPPRLVNHLTGNRAPEDLSFRWYENDIPGWSLTQYSGEGSAISLTRENPMNQASPTALKVTIPENGKAGIRNSGFWGMNLQKGESYRLRLFAHGSFDGTVSVRLLGKNDAVLSSYELPALSSGWNEIKNVLTPSGTCVEGSLEILLEGKGTLLFDYVSLFPEDTFHGRENGLRKDIAETLDGLHPAFVRWPGGCIVEGITLSDRVKWKETIGDPAQRPGVYDTWGYRATMGFGYHEFLEFCEDLGADGMYVCNVGLGCQGRVGDACPDSEVDYFVQDALDAIDYALGDGTTKWSAMRVAAGHPEPFPLKYVEIGNENWGPLYEKRYSIFYNAIKARYPELILISNLGLGGQKRLEKVDMLDPHFYVAPEWFFSSATIFDGQQRGDYSIYVGEYAANNNVGSGNLLAALSEAAFLTGAERNGDVVKMMSYAPLLENVNDRVWPANLIWFDSHRVMGRASYYVQKLFAENRPDYNFPVAFETGAAAPQALGKIGLGSYLTDCEYKDLKVTLPDGKVVTPDLSEGWDKKSGVWTESDNVLKCTGADVLKSAIWDAGERFGDCTIDLKARKISGNEGFIVFFGMEGEDGYVLNIGGWGNSSTAFQTVHGADMPQIPGNISQNIETGKWYDLKLTVEGSRFSFYLDGEETLTIVRQGDTRRFCVSGYDEKTREMILKFVNASESAFTTKVVLDGAKKVASKGKVTTLSYNDPEAENTLDEPTRIVPVTSSERGFASSFNYTFTPWSTTIIRIHVNK